jgi:hypothetical protein
MAVRKIAFPVVYQQNQNDQSSAYGKQLRGFFYPNGITVTLVSFGEKNSYFVFYFTDFL